MAKITVKLTSSGTTHMIPVPESVFESFGMDVGDEIEIFVSESGLYIPLEKR
jgi:bifunctional DNA-binding transcriptional regulator/antitoxin component of YhaV-PrlF toxin-antitoxin module